MTIDEFIATLTHKEPAAGLSLELESLWYDAVGDWEKAHTIVQNIPGRKAAWIHGYLHRKEPDEWNASYWYERAGQSHPNCSFEDEWKIIAKNLLDNYE